MAAKLFISYSKSDSAYRVELGKHLSPLVDSGDVTIWHDRLLIPGQEWDGKIKLELETSEIILLLVSSDFNSTQYVKDVEIKRAMERHESGSAVVIPVILRACVWEQLPFGKLTALPNDDKDKAKPITQWTNPDDAYVNVVLGIKRALTALDARPMTPPSSATTTTKSAIHNLGMRNRFFTGREVELKQLAATLLSRKSVAVYTTTGTSDTQVIQGLGGIGKSQLVLEYAWRHLHDYEVIWWIRAESGQTLQSDIASLGERIGLAGTNVEERSQAALGWLEYHDNWLIVLDNAPNPAGVTEWIPPNHAGHLLITTRHRAGWKKLANALDMDVMSKEEGSAFLLHRMEMWNTATKTQRQTADTLTEELGGLPLALEQAASYMDEMTLSLEVYLKKFRAKGLALMNSISARPTLGEYAQTIYTTWQLSFDQAMAENPMACVLLNLMSFLEPDDIPRSLLWEWRARWLNEEMDWARRLPDEDAYDLALTTLHRFALIRLEKEKDSLSIHRLVGAVTRDRLGEEGQQRYLALVLAVMRQAYDIEFHDMAARPDARRLHHHVLNIARMGEHFGVDLIRVNFLYNRCALFWVSQAAYGLARELFEHALSLAETIHGPEHPNVAPTLNNLGLMLHEQGDLTGAREIFERTLAIGEKYLDPDHPTIAIRLNNLGSVLRKQGNLSEARELIKRALEIGDKSLDPDHPEMAKWLNNMGMVLLDSGELLEARQHLERALRIRIKILGSEHPEVALCLSNMALVLKDQGDIAGARDNYVRSLTILRASNLPPDHPHIQQIEVNLAYLDSLMQSRNSEPPSQPAFRPCS